MWMHIVAKAYQFKYIIARILEGYKQYKEAIECLD